MPGTRLFFTHADALNGPRTYVLLGNQRHLTFVADLEDHVDLASLRSVLIERFGLYPHLIDLDPAPGLPRLFEDQRTFDSQGRRDPSVTAAPAHSCEQPAGTIRQ
ncbi:MAG: hypothetical protein E6I75_29255 [Chloroflexi bacterium]|nr:MAG: hypothetical protein E6I75_29255 [Chloroflexota bacterium]